MRYQLLLLITAFVVVVCSCENSTQVNSRAYEVNVKTPNTIKLDSVVVSTIISSDTVLTHYASDDMSLIYEDSTERTLKITFDVEAQKSQHISVEYTCYVEDIPIITKKNRFTITDDTPESDVFIDSLMIETLEEYQQLVGVDVAVNAFLFDSLFIHYMLDTSNTNPDRYYDYYKLREGVDTTNFIHQTLLEIEKRVASQAPMIIYKELPEPILAAVLNTPEPLIFSGTFTAHTKEVATVILSMSGDNFPEPITIHVDYDSTMGEYSGYIELLEMSNTFTIAIQVFDHNGYLTGFNTKDFTFLSRSIELPQFDPWNAKPWVSIPGIQPVSINDTHEMSYSAGDSIHAGTLITTEYRQGEGTWVLVSGEVVTFTAPDTEALNYPLYIRVMDNDSNVTVDSLYITVVSDLPTINLAARDALYDVADSIYFDWTGSDHFGTIVTYELAAEKDMKWLNVSQSNSLGIRSLNEAGSFNYILKAIDDDANVVYDTLTVTVIEDPPLISTVTITGTPHQGNTLTVNYTYSDFLGDPEGASIIQWYSDGEALVLANEPTYNIQHPDKGKKISVGVIPVALSGGVPKGIEVISEVSAVVTGFTAPVTGNIIVDLHDLTINDLITFGLNPNDAESDLVDTVWWDFNNDGFYETTSNANEEITQSFSTVGEHTVQVYIQDSVGNRTNKSIIVPIIQDAPVAKAEMFDLGSVTTEHITVSGSQSIDGIGHIVEFAWSAGGLPFTPVGHDAGDTTFVLPETPNSNYPIVLRVTDDDGFVNFDTLTVNVTDGLIDNRDGRQYRAVSIDTLHWMAENLDYDAGEGSYCFYFDVPGSTHTEAHKDSIKAVNCGTYGRLYNNAVTVSNDHVNGKDVCPMGWRLPTLAEWRHTYNFVSTEDPTYSNNEHLKSKEVWAFGEGGIDTYGFSILPGGNCVSENACNDALGSNALLWTSDYAGIAGGVHRHWSIVFENNNSAVREYDGINTYGFSVRCVEDQ
ncbi:MAG: hypothetical protein OCC49_13615 [Fibrobacterales bacterium]